MKATPETINEYKRAMGLAMCGRSFAALGMWFDAHKCFDEAKMAWLKVEWLQ